MRASSITALLCFGLGLRLDAAPPQSKASCRRASITGELNAGNAFVKPISHDLSLFFQPIASGWILRVIPQAGPAGDHDYAELATPPYDSVNPLSISTDFAFRAQDAVGWNPRRFRFATSKASFDRLQDAWLSFEHGGATPAPPLQVELSSNIAQAASGTFTILDARLTPGTANQWMQAAAVASHFTTTAHTLVSSADGSATPLGQIRWIRFRVDLDLPAGFVPSAGIPLLPRSCDAGPS